MLTYGTRGTGTESLTYRILQTPTYRTVPIIARLLDAAIIAGPKDDLDGLARRILNRIARYGDSAIPRTEFDLVSWADLAIEAPTGARKSTYRPKARTFKACAGCGRRFLARRANNLTCSPRCRARASRRVVTDSQTGPS